MFKLDWLNLVMTAFSNTMILHNFNCGQPDYIGREFNLKGKTI
jgi:hypothetical protein